MAPKKATERSARTSSSAAAVDEKESSCPTSWWIGGGILGTIVTIILGVVIYNCLTSKVKTGNPCPSEKHDECLDDAVCVEETEEGTHKDKFVCKAVLGGKCLVNQKTCAQHADLGSPIRGLVFAATLEIKCDLDSSTCQVFPSSLRAGDCKGFKTVVKDGKDGKDGGSLCKGSNGTPCASPRGTAMQWCEKGSTCQLVDRSWKCEADKGKSEADKGGKDKSEVVDVPGTPFKPEPHDGAGGQGNEANGESQVIDVPATPFKPEKPLRDGANIQLAETTDIWHAASSSLRAKSNNLRKKRTETSGVLQVDFD